jgi:hypothetical protein
MRSSIFPSIVSGPLAEGIFKLAPLAAPNASSPNTTSTHRAMTIISQSYPVG